MDLNTNAFRIVNSLTGGSKNNPRTEAACAGGRVGSQARANRLNPDERRAAAVKASQARWDKIAPVTPGN
jgi:hypothetical protein